jgi:divalent metal cation (Fe/Co/Zn/Cd) transporter
MFGWKAFSAERGKQGVLEGSAALVGLAVAFFGIFLGRQLGLPYLDGVASVVIGLLLCAVAVLMVYESKGLLARNPSPMMAARR